MSHSDLTTWHIIDKDGNELNIIDVRLNHGVTIEATEYDPELSALDTLRQAIHDETLTQEAT